LSTRSIQVKRQNATTRVKSIILLKKYIELIQHKFGKYEHGFFNLSLIKRAEETTWLKAKKLGWKNWMWEYFLDVNLWNEFKRINEATELGLHNLLGMKLIRFEKLVKQFNSPSTTTKED
jgi:hypothetical protein